MVKADEACARCGKAGVALYENAAMPGQMLDFPCLLVENPRQVARYPGWREREERREQRAQLARINFGQKLGGLAALVLLLFVSSLPAQEAKPSDKLFAWTVITPSHNHQLPALKAGKDFWPLLAAQSALTVADVEQTQWHLRQDPTWRELNPFLPRRPGRARMYTQFFAGNIAADYAAWRLKRAGHPRWARVVQVGSLAIYGYCITYSSTR